MKDSVTIRKEEDDPICLRASIGGKSGQYYLTYRGDREKVMEMLRVCLKAFEVSNLFDEQKPRPHNPGARFGSS